LGARGGGLARDEVFVCSGRGRELVADTRAEFPDAVGGAVYWSGTPVLDQFEPGRRLYAVSDFDSVRESRGPGADERVAAAERRALARTDLALLLSEQDRTDAMALLGEEEGRSRHWRLVGGMGVVAGILILSYYSVIAGWTLAYILKSVTGAFVDATAAAVGAAFDSFIGDWRAVALAHTLFMLTHFVVFYVGYIGIDDITHGWLVINVWHNAQYVLFVWLFNSNRYQGGIDPKARLLSAISQPNRAWLYFAVCLGITTIFYSAVNGVIGQFSHWGLPLVVIVYQTINFHHYIVDSLIWKVRRKPLQQTLGIAS